MNQSYLENIRDDEYKALNHLISCMEFFDMDSQEYNSAQKTFAWIAEKIACRTKIEQELCHKHQRLCSTF